jgi:hypothetical protein
MSGLIASQRTRSGIPDNSTYYILKGQAIDQPALVAPISLLPENKSTTANILVEGANGAYKGALTFNPGANSTIPAVQPDGLTLRAVAGGVQVEVGTDGQAVNNLKIAGADGLSSVYDELYNQPVGLRAITMTATTPTVAPTPGNTGEILRCTQAGVLAAGTLGQFNSFRVPITGFYALQSEFKIENAAAPAPIDINVPFNVAVAPPINLGYQISLTITKGAVIEPYGSHEVVSQEFATVDILQQGGGVTRQYVSYHLFDEAETYSITLRTSSTLWNIGSGGQIKAELIAMC